MPAMNLTFEQLPQAVDQLNERLDRIEQLLLPKGKDSQPDPDELLNIQQAAEVLHLSVPTVYGLVQHASVPVCKRGNRLYFSKHELTSWILSGRKKTVSEIESEANQYISTRKAKHKF
jgi:hypothetical protein